MREGNNMEKQEMINKFADQVLKYQLKVDRADGEGDLAGSNYYMGQMQAVYDVAREVFDIWNFDINPIVREHLNR